VAIATATTQRGHVTDAWVEKYNEIFHRKDGFLAQYNIERPDEIDLLGISLIGGLDPLFIGAPGTGKTWLIELVLLVLEGANPEDFFNTMIFKETPADDILGMRNLPAMKEGRIERMMEGYLPMAVVAYLDEVFKGSPTLLNAFLDIMATRKLKVGRTVHSVGQLLSIMGSSNELPDREDLGPFRDRWSITKFVQPVRTPEGRKTVHKIQDEYQANGNTIDLTDAPRLTLDEMHEIRGEVRRIIIPDGITDKLVDLEEKFEQAGHLPSSRRQGHMKIALKASAWRRGEGEVSTNDISVLQHMAFNDPDDADSARTLVIAVSSVFARRAAGVKTALEPMSTEISRIRGELQGGRDIEELDSEGNSLMEDGYKVMRDLRKLRKTARKDIEEGKGQGEDVTELEDLVKEINREAERGEQIIGGDDDDV
jgi:MoxR-like ATPase